MTNSRKALQPFYIMNSISEELLLYSGCIELSNSSKPAYVGNGSISFKWFSSPRIELEIKTNSENEIPVVESQCLKIDQEKLKLEESSSSMLRSLLKEFSDSVDDNQSLSYVIFHLVNFRNFHGQPIHSEKEQGKIYCGRAVLQADNWLITLDAQDKTKQNERDLDLLSGYSITHIGKIERSDGKNFTVSEVKNILDCLHFFFSFARGRWSSPILPIGYDVNDNKVWMHWEATIIDSWQTQTSWFNLTDKSLSELFPGFFKRWSNNDLNEPIKIAIQWYVECRKGSGGIAGSIALAQIAMELFSSIVITEEKKILSVDSLSKLNASDQFKLLLSIMGIPMNIPTTLSDLTQVAGTLSSDSQGPEALTYIRNRIVHAKVKNIKALLTLPDNAMTEAWKLGYTYIQLILLRLFEYQGKYLNWLEKTDTTEPEGEDVPWVVEASK